MRFAGLQRVGAMVVVATVIGGGAAVVGATAASAGETATVTVGTTPVSYPGAADITVDVAAATAGDPVPQGTVELFVDGTDEGDQALDGTTDHLDFNVSSLAVGSHSVEADYTSSDGIFDSSSGTGSQQVDPADPTLSVQSSGSPSLFGQSVTFTATLTDGAGAVSGSTITFKDGATTLGTPTTDSNGQASVSVSNLAGGAHTISATSTATTNDNAAGPSTTPQQVNPNDFTLSVPDITVFVGDIGTLSIQGTASNGGTIAPKVAFNVTEGTTTLIPDGSLDSTGFENVAIGPFIEGTHTLTVTTTASGNWNSESTTVTVTAVRETTLVKTSMKFATTPHRDTTPVTLHATVALAPGEPVLGRFSGTFAFYVDGVSVGTAPVTRKGIATLPLSSGIGGTAKKHQLIAIWSGDDLTYPSGTSLGFTTR